ncbi:hypothetical protein EMCRGX_G022506 [Ephydatia muelleri]|eukprot:Em0009g1248a
MPSLRIVSCLAKDVVRLNRRRTTEPLLQSLWSRSHSNTPALRSANPPMNTDLLKQLSGKHTDPRDKRVASVKGTSTDMDKLPVMHIYTSYNNTIFTIADYTGRVLAWTSAGSEGFHNARRGTTFAAQSAAAAAARKASNLGLQRFRVQLKGPGQGRQSSLKGLEMGGLSIVSIQDVTPIPHNGCRPKKARRL